MTTPICPLPHRHDPERPRRAADGLVVCRGCRDAVERAVAELPGLYGDLSGSLQPSKRPGAKVSGTKEYALPIDPNVADERDMIRAQLVSWCLLVAEERDVAQPANGDPRTTGAWLTTHVDYILATDYAADFATEMRERRGKALSLLYPDGRRSFSVGPCPTEDCDGTLTVILRDTDSLLPSALSCRDCGEEWTAGEWIRLGRKLHEGAA